MASGGRKWPYKPAQKLRSRRVLRVRDDEAPRGVQRRDGQPPRPWITPWQARLIVAVAAACAVGMFAAWAYQSPYLTVQHVTVRGTISLSPDQVRAAAALDGDSTFTLDEDGAERRILALEGVRTAAVEKTSWNSVTITIDERVAWGSWRINGVDVPIDREGYVLAGAPAAPGLPVIVEVEPQRAVNVGDRLDPGAVDIAARVVEEADTAFGRQVLALLYRRDAGLTVVMTGADVDDPPLWVTFGDSRDYDFKVATLYVLMERARQSGEEMAAVDLRFGDRVAYQ